MLQFSYKRCVLLCVLWLAVRPATLLAAAPTAAQWHAVTSGKEFAYRNDVETLTGKRADDNGALQKMIASVISFFDGPGGRAILWCVAIAIVVFIVYKLVLSKDSIFFGKSGKSMKPASEATPDAEDLAVTDWDALRLQAMNSGEGRLAIRYAYMRLLQLLQQKGLISFSADKTNSAYYSEMGDSAHTPSFRQLSRIYEYAWYGRYELTRHEYERYNLLFDGLKKQLGA